MRRALRSSASAIFSISRWWTAISFSQSRRFSYICLRKASASALSGSSSRIGLERLDRLGLVRELLEEQVGDAQVQRDLLGRVLDHRRLLAQQRDQVRPALHGLVLRGQRVGRLEVVRLDVQDLVEGVDHHHVELQPLAIDLDHLEAGPGSCPRALAQFALSTASFITSMKAFQRSAFL